MSKFLCTCGHSSSNVTWPTLHEAWLITDSALDDASDYTRRNIAADVPRRNVIECLKCGRLWVQKTVADRQTYIPFAPEGERLNILKDRP